MTDKNLEQMIKKSLNDTAKEIQENPYAKQKVLSAIRRKESCTMRNKKSFTKKAVITLAAVICLSATTVLAAGGELSSWVSHTTLSDPSYSTVEEVMEASDDFGFTPYIIDEFDNGYKFENARLTKFDGRDNENNTLCTVKSMDAEYFNESKERLYLTAEKLPETVKESVIQEETQYTPESETTHKDIVIQYHFDPYKLVSTDYQPTDEEKALMEAGELFISTDSDQHHDPEYYNLLSVQWTIDGVDYNIFGFDYETSVTESDLYAMAQQLIDMQLANK